VPLQKETNYDEPGAVVGRTRWWWWWLQQNEVQLTTKCVGLWCDEVRSTYGLLFCLDLVRLLVV